MNNCTKYFCILLISMLVINSKAESIDKPNFIIFYVDDLGWQDTELYPTGDEVPWETPNVMRLAARGMQFTQAYSPAPTCSPSRGAILSGQHPAKTHFTHVLGAQIPTQTVSNKLISPFYKNHVPDDAITIASALVTNGYRTGQIGKWHLGEHHEQVPTAMGFDYAFRDRGVHRQMDDRSKDFATADSTDKYVLSEEKYPPISAKNPEGISYPKDLVTDSAIAFIDSSKSGPFFLYLAHWMVHYPIITRNRALLEYYCDKLGIPFPEDDSPITTPGQTNPYYGAMVTTMDWSLGRIIDYLEATDDPRNAGKKLIETTYIFFTSDNGGCEKHSTEVITDNYPLDEGKKYAQEGGVRVPMLISGPTINAVSQYSGLVNQLDYFPTIMALSQTSIEASDEEKLWGADISSVLNGTSSTIMDKSGVERRNLFWHFPHNADYQMQSSLRDGDYKLYKNHIDGSYELYQLYNNDTLADINEQINIAERAENASTLQGLVQSLEQHLLENDAEYPCFNPNYSGSLEGKEEIPVVVANTYDVSSREASVRLEAGKSALTSAYVLVERSEEGEVTYEKVEASIASDKLTVTVAIPLNREKYMFILIDENNFMIKSELYEVINAVPIQSVVVEADTNTYYGIDKVVVLTSDLQTAPDSLASYRISVAIHPQSGKSIMSSPDDVNWGVANNSEESTDVRDYVFWGTDDDSVFVNDIQVVDFDANGGQLSQNNITEVYFSAIDFTNGNTADKDGILFTIDGESYERGNRVSDEFSSFVGDDAKVTKFSLQNSKLYPLNTNKWSVKALNISVVFDVVTANNVTESNKSNTLHFLPNPARDWVELNIEPKKVSLYNLNGKCVRVFTEGENRINVADLLPNVYLVRVQTLDDEIMIGKLCIR